MCPTAPQACDHGSCRFGFISAGRFDCVSCHTAAAVLQSASQNLSSRTSCSGLSQSRSTSICIAYRAPVVPIPHLPRACIRVPAPPRRRSVVAARICNCPPEALEVTVAAGTSCVTDVVSKHVLATQRPARCLPSVHRPSLCRRQASALGRTDSQRLPPHGGTALLLHGEHRRADSMSGSQ